MPFLTTWAPFCAVVLPMWTMLSPWSKQSHGCSCQGCKATNHTGTLRNLPNPASGTYTNTGWNSPEPSGTFGGLPEPSGTFRNLPPEPTPAYTGTFRNLPELASRTYTILRWNSPEPSGTLRNLHHDTPELSGTFRNPPPEPAPAARTGTHRSLSGLKTPLAYAVGEKKTSPSPPGPTRSFHTQPLWHHTVLLIRLGRAQLLRLFEPRSVGSELSMSSVFMGALQWHSYSLQFSLQYLVGQMSVQGTQLYHFLG